MPQNLWGKIEQNWAKLRKHCKSKLGVKTRLDAVLGVSKNVSKFFQFWVTPLQTFPREVLVPGRPRIFVYGYTITRNSNKLPKSPCYPLACPFFSIELLDTLSTKLSILIADFYGCKELFQSKPYRLAIVKTCIHTDTRRFINPSSTVFFCFVNKRRRIAVFENSCGEIVACLWKIVGLLCRNCGDTANQF